MPTVPFGAPKAMARPQVDPVFEAIAIADLHEAGMLFERPQASQPEAPTPTEPKPKARSV